MPAADFAFKREEATRRAPGEGAVAGVIAGVLMAAAAMVLTSATGLGAALPWRYSASILMGGRAVTGQVSAGVIVVGVVVHFGLAALYGAFWGTLVSGLPPSVRDSWLGHTAAAALYGLLLYLVNYHLLARLLYPWFLASNLVPQALLHVFAFGAPLGAWMTARLRPLDNPAAAPSRVPQ